jgi:hypothetical protein
VRKFYYLQPTMKKEIKGNMYTYFRRYFQHNARTITNSYVPVDSRNVNRFSAWAQGHNSVRRNVSGTHSLRG